MGDEGSSRPEQEDASDRRSSHTWPTKLARQAGAVSRKSRYQALPTPQTRRFDHQTCRGESAGHRRSPPQESRTTLMNFPKRMLVRVKGEGARYQLKLRRISTGHSTRTGASGAPPRVACRERTRADFGLESNGRAAPPDLTGEEGEGQTGAASPGGLEISGSSRAGRSSRRKRSTEMGREECGWRSGERV